MPGAPPRNGLADWEVTLGLAKAMGFEMKYDHPSQIMDEIAPLDAVIHIDTGMHRLGFGPEDTQVLINERGRLRGLRLALLMSHLVVSEEPNNPINGEQLSRFRAFVKAMPGAPTSIGIRPVETSTCSQSCTPGISSGRQ